MPDGDDIGGFRLPADWADDPIFSIRPYCRRAAWLWLIQHSVNGKVNVSLRSIAEIWKWDESIVRRFVAKLCEVNLITANSSVITITNHERFQVDGGISAALSLRKARVTQAEFDLWWAHWPHKVGKEEARKAYGRARQKISKEELLAGVVRYKEAKPDHVQWCNPATWLNAGRWSDEPDYASVGAEAPGAQRKAPVMSYREPWQQRLSGFRRSGYWIVHLWGPKPGEPGCQVPRELMLNQ